MFEANVLDSFTEVRRGFEFHDSRPNFYSLPTLHGQHNKHQSMFSSASVSSYGQVINSGSIGSFNYGVIASLTGLRECPSSDEFSFCVFY
jgi:hypothetical protein